MRKSSSSLSLSHSSSKALSPQVSGTPETPGIDSPGIMCSEPPASTTELPQFSLLPIGLSIFSSFCTKSSSLSSLSSTTTSMLASSVKLESPKAQSRDFTSLFSKTLAPKSDSFAPNPNPNRTPDCPDCGFKLRLKIRAVGPGLFLFGSEYDPPIISSSTLGIDPGGLKRRRFSSFWMASAAAPPPPPRLCATGGGCSDCNDAVKGRKTLSDNEPPLQHWISRLFITLKDGQDLSSHDSQTPLEAETKKKKDAELVDLRTVRMIGVGKIKQYTNVLDRPLSKGKQEVSLSAFAFLFSELVQYNQTQVDNIAELERRLEDAGYAVGARVLELLCHREKVTIPKP
nr:trafficking protein particle complex subunit 5 [Ipomoea batatas]